MTTHTTRRTQTLRSGVALSAAAAGLVVLAACGSGGGAGGSGGTAASGAGTTGAASTGGTTVTVRDAGGMRVLATSSGATLYSSDQEQGKVLCTSSACQAVWKPLTLARGKQPTAPGGVAGDLSTLRTADGSQQVAFDGRPLYTFALDHGAGQVNGNGQADSFDGTDFSWHVAQPAGATPQSGSSGSSGGSGSGGGSGGGYGSGYGY